MQDYKHHNQLTWVSVNIQAFLIKWRAECVSMGLSFVNEQVNHNPGIQHSEESMLELAVRHVKTSGLEGDTRG